MFYNYVLQLCYIAVFRCANLLHFSDTHKFLNFFAKKYYNQTKKEYKNVK